MSAIIQTNAGVRIAIQVQPRASRTELAGLHGAAIRIRLAAPPVDGAANAALIRFLAETLGVSRAAITITSGQSGRRKSVLVTGLGLADVVGRLKLGTG
ncbi:MAG: DUF167 family protein [Gemmatimonadota bacterium]